MSREVNKSKFAENSFSSLEKVLNDSSDTEIKIPHKQTFSTLPTTDNFPEIEQTQNLTVIAQKAERDHTWSVNFQATSVNRS